MSAEAKDVALGQRPAFPTDDRGAREFSGIDTRTYIATEAMKAMLSCGGNGRAAFAFSGDTTLAEVSVKIADAMLVALTADR